MQNSMYKYQPLYIFELAFLCSKFVRAISKEVTVNLKSITAHSAVALSLVSVCSLSHASFFDNLFSSSTKEPVALSATTQEIMKNHPVWVIDGKDTSTWSVVEGKKPLRRYVAYELIIV